MAATPTGAARAPYKGEDRRRIAGPVQSPYGRPYLLALLLVALTWTVLTFVVRLPPSWSDQAFELIQMLQVASFLAAIAVGGLAFSRWYLTSDAPALWVGVAMSLYATFRLLAAELVPLVAADPGMTALASWLRPAAQIVTAVLLLRAALMVPVSTKISGTQLIGSALLGMTALTIILHFTPGLAGLIDAQGAAARGYGAVGQVGIMPVVWATIGLAFAVQGARRQRWLFTWLALLLFCIALGDVTRVVVPPPLAAGLLGKELMRLLGMSLALIGAMREILYTYRDSSTRLAWSEYSAMTAEERIRAGQAAAEERAHEARSALAAIEGATRTLEHYRDRLPPETQAALSTAVSGEIRRLQRLVSVEESDGDITEFSLAESLGPIVASERARGMDVDVRVPGDLNVLGRAGATEQVIQTLFDNARRYAPGSAITVRAVQEDGWVVMRVEDRGPGVPAQQREAIFRRGVRGHSAADVSGSGLGLYVAAQLMRDQNAELWVDDRAGGGASFALALPAADGSHGAEEPVQRCQQSGQIADGGGLGASRSRD